MMFAIRAKPSDGPSHRRQVRGGCQNIGGDVGFAALIGALVLPEPRRCWSFLNRVESGYAYDYILYSSKEDYAVMSNYEITLD